MTEGFVIISIIFKHAFTQSETGTTCKKIFSVWGEGFLVYGTGPASHFCPSLTSNLWEVPLKSVGLLVCWKLSTCISALLDWCRTESEWPTHGSECMFEDLGKFVAIDFGFKMGGGVLFIFEFPCFQQLSYEVKFYHLGGKKELESKAEGQLCRGEQNALYHGNICGVVVVICWNIQKTFTFLCGAAFLWNKQQAANIMLFYY